MTYTAISNQGVIKYFGFTYLELLSHPSLYIVNGHDICLTAICTTVHSGQMDW